MLVRDAVRDALESMHDAKERLVKKARGRRDRNIDLPTKFAIIRGDEQVATLVCSPPNREAMMEVANHAASGFCADILVVTMEQFGSTHQENPITGRPWRTHEMMKVAQEHDGLRLGLVHECIAGYAANRAGDLASARQQFRVLGHRFIEWDEVRSGVSGDEAPGDLKSFGWLADAVQGVMETETISERMARMGVGPLDFGISDQEEIEVRIDTVTVQTMALKVQTWGFPVSVALAADEGSLREKILRHHFPDLKVMRN